MKTREWVDDLLVAVEELRRALDNDGRPATDKEAIEVVLEATKEIYRLRSEIVRLILKNK